MAMHRARSTTCAVTVLTIVLVVLYLTTDTRPKDTSVVCEKEGTGDKDKSGYPFLYQRWEATCLDVAWLDTDNVPRARPWSVHPRDFSSTAPRPVCSTPQQLEDALRLGTRRWDALPPPSTTDTPAWERDMYLERAASWFEPHGCRVPFYAPEQVCVLFDRYALVAVFGDSLGRHMVGGLRMAMTGDWHLGAFPPSRHASRRLWDHCVCDGQFSEATDCRAFDTPDYAFADSRSTGGLCPGTRFGFNVEAAYRVEEFPYQVFPFRYGRDQAAAVANDGRPVLIVIQGGMHQAHNFSAFRARVIEPATRAIDMRPANASVHVVLMGSHAQSRLKDPAYPHQRREAVAAFHAALRAEADARHWHFLDHWNLTANAPSSDGVHMLSSVQLWKAQSLVHLMNLLSK